MPHRAERYKQDQADELRPSNQDEEHPEAAGGNAARPEERLNESPEPMSPYENPDGSERDVPAELHRGFPVEKLAGTDDVGPDYRPQSADEDDRTQREDREEIPTASEAGSTGRDDFAPEGDEIDPDAGLETGYIEQDDEAAMGFQKPSVDS